VRCQWGCWHYLSLFHWWCTYFTFHVIWCSFNNYIWYADVDDDDDTNDDGDAIIKRQHLCSMPILRGLCSCVFISFFSIRNRKFLHGIYQQRTLWTIQYSYWYIKCSSNFLNLLVKQSGYFIQNSSAQQFHLEQWLHKTYMLLLLYMEICH